MKALLLATLLAANAPDPAAPVTEAAEAELYEPPGPARFRGALEVAVLSLPSGPPGGGQDLFLSAMPLLSFDGGPDFGLELGAPMRLRVFDDPPEQRDRDFGGILRREDWDSLSDYGQVLRELRIGTEGSLLQLRAGRFAAFTLGNGQLISRYANGLNPDYHPAGAQVVMALGATRTEVFASDVLGGRLFAAELLVDLARATGASTLQHNRYHASVSVAHDFGRAGGTSPQMSLAWLELDAALLRAKRARITGYLGGGGRALDDGASVGATLGVAAEGDPRGMKLGGRLEIRKSHSGFRPGMIGFDYELARFSGVGLGLPPLAAERLPDAFSFYGEFAAAFGGEDDASLSNPGLTVSASGEYFTFGRTHLDLSVQGRAFNGKGALGLRVAVSGLGQAPRYLTATEVRYRLMPSLYLLGTGGTVFFPQPDSTLSRGFFVSFGAGADFER